MRRMLATALVLAAAILVAPAAPAAPTCTISWSAGAATNAWGTAANWNLARVPNATDHVCIPAAPAPPTGGVVFSTGTVDVLSIQAGAPLMISGGTLNITDTTAGNESSLAALTMSGGVLGGAATLNVSGATTWTGGRMTGAGTTRISGTLARNTGSSAYLDATRVLEIAGTATVADGQSINLWGGTPVLAVLPGGTLQKAAGAGTSVVDVAVDNDGIARSLGGVLSLNDGTGPGRAATGNYGEAVPAGTVRLDAGTHELGAGAALVGGADMSADVNVAGGAVVPASGNNTYSAGLLGGAGTLDVTGTMTWSGGRMTGTGTTRVAAGGVFTRVAGSSAYLDATRVIEVLGTLRVADAQSVSLWGGTPQIHVASGGVLEKGAGAGTSVVDVSVDNDGVARSLGGVLSLNDGSGAGHVSTGDFGEDSATPAGIVRLDGGAFTLGTGAELIGGADISANTDIATGATAIVRNANTYSSGVLGGDGTLSVTGTLTWSGGRMGGAGVTQVAPGGTLARAAGSAAYLDATRLVDVAGTMRVADGQSVSWWAGTPRIHIAATGTLEKAAGAGSSVVDIPVDNDGLVRSLGGVLGLNDGSGPGQVSTGDFGESSPAGTVRLDAGAFVMGSGAELLGGADISADTSVATGATVTSRSTNTLSAGVLGGDGTLDVVGTLNFAGGRMGGAGLTQVSAGGVLARVAGASAYLDATRVVEVAGTLRVADAQTLSRWAGTPRIHVASGGVLEKAAGAGTSVVDVPVDNDGLARSLGGTLNLRDGGGTGQSATGDFGAAAAAGSVGFDGGTFTLAQGARLLGGTDVKSGTVTIGAGVTVPASGANTISGGTVGGSGTLDVTGTLTWAGGTQTGTGITRVAGTLLVQGCSVTLSGGRTLDVDGAMTVLRQTSINTSGSSPAPAVDIAPAATLTFDDTLAGTCGQTPNSVRGITGTATIRNLGTIDKLAGATISRVGGALDNDGTVRARAGTLQLAGGSAVTQSGTFGVSGDAGTVAFVTGLFTLEATVTTGGNLTLDEAEVVAPGTVMLTVGPGSTFTQTGGILSGAGTLRILGTLVWSEGTQRDGTTVIEPGATATVGGAAFSWRTIENGRVVANRGTLTVGLGSTYLEGGASLLNSGTAELGDLARLEGPDGFDFGGGALVHNTGVIRKTAGTGLAEISPALDNDGTVEVTSGTLGLRGTILNYSTQDKSLTGGTWIARNGATLGLPATVSVNAARIVLDGSDARVMTLDFNGAPQADALAALARNGGAGAIELLGGKDLVVPGPFQQGGILRAGAGSTFAVNGAYEQTAGLTQLGAPSARLTATGAQVRLTGGRLTGSGSAGPAVAIDGGVLDPGLADSGTLGLDTVTLGAASTTRVRLTGATPGTGFGQLQVAGAAALGGTLAIETDPGFVPPVGTQIVLATAGARSGGFAALTGAEAAPGVTWQVSYATPNQVRLVATSASRSATRPANDSQAAPAAAAAPPAPAAPAPAAPAPAAPAPTEPGAARTVQRHRVHGRRVTVVVRTCATCGTLRIHFRGRLVRTLSLRSTQPGTRRVVVLRSARPRRGTLVLRGAAGAVRSLRVR